MKNNNTILYKLARNINYPVDFEFQKNIVEMKLNRIFVPITYYINQLINKDGINLEINHYNSIKLNELKNVLNLFKQNDIPFVNIKGIAMQKYYPKDLLRQSNDFDVLIKSYDDLWKCHRILTELGFKIELNPLISSNRSVASGIFTYVKSIRKDLVIEIELNIGDYCIYSSYWLDSAYIWDNCIKFNYDEFDFFIPNDDLNMNIFLIETISRNNNIFIRDLIDFHFLKKPHLEFSFIKHREYKGLNKVLKLLYSQYYKIDSNFSKNDIIPDNLNFNTRIIRSIFLTYINISQKKSFKSITLSIILSLGYHLARTNKLLNLVGNLEKKMNVKDICESGFPIHMYLITDNLKGPFEWIKYKDFSLLLTPIGLYLGTIFATISEEDENDIIDFANNQIAP